MVMPVATLLALPALLAARRRRSHPLACLTEPMPLTVTFGHHRGRLVGADAIVLHVGATERTERGFMWGSHGSIITRFHQRVKQLFIKALGISSTKHSGSHHVDPVTQEESPLVHPVIMQRRHHQRHQASELLLLQVLALMVGLS